MTELETLERAKMYLEKLANGITARVVRDTVRSEGDLVEDTFDWYAQDSAGNVWYLGEDTAEFENGKIVTRSGSFEAGVGGALPGILLPAAMIILTAVSMNLIGDWLFERLTR